MTSEELVALMLADTDEFLKFDRVQNPRSTRPDLHAFMLLDEMDPGTDDIVSCAEHDQFWLSVDLEVIAEKITPEQVTDLIRCGIMLGDDEDSFCMFA